MILPKWDKEKYSIANELLDEQHENLFNIALKAYKIANNPAGASREEIRGVIIEFFEYCKVHFKDEEKYMELIDYPYLIQHKESHRRLSQELKKMIKNVKSGNELKEHIAYLAADWFIPHILKDDMQIEEYRKNAAKTNPNLYIYIYGCSCEGKEYKLNEAIHLFLKKHKDGFACRRCKEKIALRRLDTSLTSISQDSTIENVANDITPPPPQFPLSHA